MRDPLSAAAVSYFWAPAGVYLSVVINGPCAKKEWLGKSDKIVIRCPAMQSKHKTQG